MGRFVDYLGLARLTRRLGIVLVACTGLIANDLHAGDLLLFPSLTLARTLSTDRGESGAGMDMATSHDTVKNTRPALDIFYSADHGKLRFLAEGLLTEEHQELERLQLGWQLNPEHTIWIGNFHTPVGHWNMQYHHGRHLQTSITRPAIVEFEHEGGILPMHMVGTWLEGFFRQRGDSVWHYDLAAGVGPKMAEDELEHASVIKPNSHGRLTLATRLSFYPDATRDTQAGIALGQTRIPVSGMQEGEARLRFAGFFANWEHEPLRLFGELFYVHDRVDADAEIHEGSFVSGYTQAEYRFAAPFTLFGRIEATQGAMGDPYVALLPSFPRAQTSVGLRFDVNDDHALTVEAYRERLFETTTRKRISLQWSGAFSF